MTLFDEGGNRIDFAEWIKTYEPYYFLGGPTFGRRITNRNKTSHFVEDTVCRLLYKDKCLSREDLILVMAWKMGLINHQRSDVDKTIVYAPPDWPQTLTDPRYGRINFAPGIHMLASKMPEILSYVRQNRPRYLFDMSSDLQGFGTVYILTMLFFVSRGVFPIYDRFAHVAIEAIQEDVRPDGVLRYKGVTKWEDYTEYMKRLGMIKTLNLGSNDGMFVPRSLDRALWVYGHFFDDETGKSGRNCR